MSTRPFRLAARGGDVPGVVWSADRGSGGGRPLVLLGHGGSGHKAGERNVRLATELVRRHRIDAVAVDGPFHGDRAVDDYQGRMAEQGVEAVVERVVAEWLAVIRTLRSRLDFDGLGYLGLSMGSRFGVPLAARLGGELGAAVLGKYGVRHTGALHPGLNAPDHSLAAARAVTAPVLFHLERHDEVYAADSQLELYDALGSADKTLRTRDGGHRSRRPDDELAWVGYWRVAWDPAALDRPFAPRHRPERATTGSWATVLGLHGATAGTTTVAVLPLRVRRLPRGPHGR